MLAIVPSENYPTVKVIDNWVINYFDLKLDEFEGINENYFKTKLDYRKRYHANPPATTVNANRLVSC